MPRELTPFEVAEFRDRLCTAAEELFARYGPEAVSMRQLAAAINVSCMTPYRYFQDKEEILAAVRSRGFERLAETMEEARRAAIGSANQRMATIADAYLDFAFSNSNTYKLMFDLRQSNECSYPNLIAAAGRAHAVMSGYVQDLIDNRLLKGNPEEIGQMGWAATHGAVVLELAGHLPEGSARSLSRSVANTIELRFGKSQ